MKTKIIFSFVTLAALVTVTIYLLNDEEPLWRGDEPMGNFFNVISQSGADPWMYKHADDRYYYTKTTGGDVTLKRASTLTGIEAGEIKVIWWPSGETAGFRDIWAPEIHYIDQKWYVYFAALSPEYKSHRMYVLENDSQDPFSGSWEFKGQITDQTNKTAIDGTVFENRGTKYFVWSGWEGDVNISQNIYIATMSNPWTINSERIEISRPEHAWETNHRPYINEGPQFIVKNETINLVYSASGSWTDDYSLGLITANHSADLMNPASWLKRDQPIFKSANGLYGPGHHSFTQSPDGTEDWIVYHTAKWKGSGWTRLVRAQSFIWNEDDTPDLGEPVDPNQLIPTPAGEEVRIRYEAENAKLSDGLQVEEDAAASGGMKVSSDDGKGGTTSGAPNLSWLTIEFEVDIDQAGTYLLSSRVKNINPDKSQDFLRVHVEGEVTFQYSDYTGKDTWTVTFTTVQLQKGKNVLQFKLSTETSIEFDAIELAIMEREGNR